MNEAAHTCEKPGKSRLQTQTLKQASHANNKQTKKQSVVTGLTRYITSTFNVIFDIIAFLDFYFLKM